MKLRGLRERLLRELAKHKAKSAVLAVLCLVACYFWVPLVANLWKMDRSSPSSEPGLQTVVVLNSQSAKQVIDLPAFHWKEFWTWTAGEPRMTVLAVSPDTRDPFVPSEPEELAIAEEKGSSEAGSSSSPPEATNRSMVQPEPVKSPTECGLVLRSTVVGERISTANINGTNYQLHGWIPIPNPDGELATVDPVAGFKLVGVKSRSVTLERQGQFFELEMQPSMGGEANITIRSIPR